MSRTGMLLALAAVLLSGATARKTQGSTRALLQFKPPSPPPDISLFPPSPPPPTPLLLPPSPTPLPGLLDPPPPPPGPSPPPGVPPPPPALPPPPPPVVLLPPPPPVAPSPPPTIPSPPPPPPICTGLIGCIVAGVAGFFTAVFGFAQQVINFKLTFLYNICSLFSSNCINYAPPTPAIVFG